MKLTDDQFKQACDAACVFFVRSTIGTVAYLVVVVWWVGLIDTWHAEEVLKHQTCYTQYAFSEAHQVNNVTVSYCGESTGTAGGATHDRPD